ncbi:MAG: acyl--CoA ligase [Parvularculaceae bacterium]|nr:acyl--CoA ligase [Parvularculaceae bacterium]
MADAVLDPIKVFAAMARQIAEEPMFAVGEAEIRGNSYRIFKNAPPSLVGVFKFGATHGDKDFLLFEDERLSFREAFARSWRLSHALQARFGVRKGDKVAIAMRNYPEWCIAYMAIISLGAVAVPLNAWWKSEELHYGLKDCGAKLVFVDGRRLEYLLPHKEELGLTFVLARDWAKGADISFEDLLASSSNTAPPDVSIDPEDDFSIVYTSGSTGNPKGVILTHRGVVTTLFSWAFVAAAIKEARGGVSLFGDNPGILLAVPLFHVTGSHSLFLMSMIVGRRVCIMYKWDARHAIELINKHQLTNFVGVPSQSYELIEAAGDTQMPSLVDLGSGGAKRPPEHVRRLREKFPTVYPASGYGLSETNALGCIISLDDYLQRPESTGRAVPPVCDIKIMTETGEARTGEVGEVWIRTAANFRGYLNLPQETARALTPDGWFRSGDLGKVDEEGFLYIVDRLKDLIIRGGENISCVEVENRAYQHDAVAEASAFSVPDQVLGERVGLVVYPKGPLDPKALRDFMGEELAAFKVPERIWISPQPLPRLGTEKFDKRTIRMVALQHPPAWKA